MKKLLTLALALVALATFGGLAKAQQQSKQKSPSVAISKKQMTGKVTQVNEKAKTFTVTTKDKSVTFRDPEDQTTVPKVGEIVDITYTENPNGPSVVGSISLNSSRSNVY
jgi:hypothetical protein